MVVFVSGQAMVRVRGVRRRVLPSRLAGARDPVRMRVTARGSSRPLGVGGTIVAWAARAHQAGCEAWRLTAERAAPRGLRVGV